MSGWQQFATKGLDPRLPEDRDGSVIYGTVFPSSLSVTIAVVPHSIQIEQPNGRASPCALPIASLLALLRPKQWTKNLACLLPAFCSGNGVSIRAFEGPLITALAFCLGAGFVYVVNDLADIERDRIHPTKRLRPLAGGTVGRGHAAALAICALVLSGVLGASVSLPVFSILLSYIVLNLCYSLRLKQIAILDVMLISAGFILRLAAGGQAGGVPISAWLVLCAFFLSLFLAFGKRRAELDGPNPGNSREVLGSYTELMLDRFSNISATLAIATYSVFCVVSRPDHALLLTCPPVVFGMFRYLLLLETQREGEAPELVLIKDRPIQIAILLWFISYAAVLFFGIRLGVI